MFAIADVDVAVDTRGVSLASSRDYLEIDDTMVAAPNTNVHSSEIIGLTANSDNSILGKRMHKNLSFVSCKL